MLANDFVMQVEDSQRDVVTIAAVWFRAGTRWTGMLGIACCV